MCVPGHTQKWSHTFKCLCVVVEYREVCVCAETTVFPLIYFKSAILALSRDARTDGYTHTHGCLELQYKSFYFIFRDTGQVHIRGKRDVSLVAGFTSWPDRIVSHPTPTHQDTLPTMHLSCVALLTVFITLVVIYVFKCTSV